MAYRSGLTVMAVVATAATIFAGTANAAPPARGNHPAAPLAAPRGFSLIRSVRNPDGTIAATLQSKSGQRIYYLGRPGARISLVRDITSSMRGHHKKAWRMEYGVALHMPSSGSPSTAARSAQSAPMRLAALRSAYSADAERGGFPESAAKAFAKDIKDVAAPASIVGSTCLQYNDGENVTVNGCDTRTGLQSKSGDSYLADDMLANIYVGKLLGIDLTRINDWIGYSSTTTNNVVNYDPKQAESTNCNSLGTWGVSWLDVSFSSQQVLCGGTMTPWGLNEWKGGGGWSGALYVGTVQLEPIIEDHNTYSPGGHTDPTSTWTFTTVTSAVTSTNPCPFSASGKCR